MGYELWVDGRFVAKLDMAWPDLKVAVEPAGYAYHSGWGAFVKDRKRHNGIVGAGWSIVLTTWGELEDDPGGFCASARAALDLARARLQAGAA
jgi:hypothetical protein